MELSAGIKPRRVGDKKSAYVVCMRSSPFSTIAVRMPGVELARAHAPSRSTIIRPPRPCTLSSRYWIAAFAASSARMPRHSTNSATVLASKVRRKYSPTPVQETAQLVLSANVPAPTTPERRRGRAAG